MIKNELEYQVSQEWLEKFEKSIAAIEKDEDNDYEDASFLDVRFVIDALDIKIQKGEFLVPLDTLRRTPVTKEELLSSNQRSQRQQSQKMIGQVQ